MSPPGVGKTSLGESIARATNGKFVRMALGVLGMKLKSEDIEDLYWVNARENRSKASKVGVKNPLFLLDEIDKMGQDHREIRLRLYWSS